jgi:tRNA(Ile)-lysidine synthase
VLTQNALPDARVRRFADDFARLTGARPDDRLGIAVSGGPDSVALLLLAASAFPGQVEAATVDHGLRSASVEEALFVADLCATRGIPHAILTLEALPVGNLSAHARTARYAALDAWMDARAINWLLTAHHADDQLETVIMRLNRGSGVAGLSGVRAKQARTVRPLLGWRRTELAALVAESGIIAVDDPSNRDDRYDRARLRKALATADWLDPLAVVSSAAALGDADAAIEWSVDVLERQHVTMSDDGVVFAHRAANLPVEYCRRLVARCLLRVDPSCRPRGDALTRLIETLIDGRAATLGNVVVRRGDSWHFSPAPPRRPTPSQ